MFKPSIPVLTARLTMLEFVNKNLTSENLQLFGALDALVKHLPAEVKLSVLPQIEQANHILRRIL